MYMFFILSENLSYTDWDKWEVHGHRDFKLQEFLHHFKVRSISLSIDSSAYDNYYNPVSYTVLKRQDFWGKNLFR